MYEIILLFVLFGNLMHMYREGPVLHGKYLLCVYIYIADKIYKSSGLDFHR